jgi:phytoene dehydrogenase-like protein
MPGNLSFDAIIIGGGHNGLVCANVLARKNKRVLICEARKECGGMVNNDITNYVPPVTSAVSSSIGGMQINYIPKTTIALSETGQHIRLVGNQHIDHKSISTFSSHDADRFNDFHEKMSKFSKTLGSFMMASPPRIMNNSFSDYFKLFKLGLNVRLLGKKNFNEFARMIGLNIADELEDNFENTLLQGLIAHDSVIGSNLGPRSPGSLINLLYRMAIHNNSLFGGIFQIEGGNDQFTKHLIEKCKSNNVEIKTSASVKNCIIENDCAVGVELNNGEKMYAKKIISNADPRSTYFSLLGSQNLDTDVKRKIKHHRSKGRVAKLILELDKLPSFNNCDENDLDSRMVVAPSIDYIEETFNPSKFDKLSLEPTLEICVKKESDQNPKLDIQVQYAPYKTHQGWENIKESYVKSIIRIISKYAPNINECIERKKLLTPDDIESEYNVSGGHWHHGEIQIDQLFMMRPIPGASQYKTHLDGLFMCGAGTHPGGGLTGISGKNAAKAVLDDF